MFVSSSVVVHPSIVIGALRANIRSEPSLTSNVYAVLKLFIILTDFIIILTDFISLQSKHKTHIISFLVHYISAH